MTRDPRLEPFRHLRRRSGTRLVVEGEIAVQRALESSFRAETVVAIPSAAARLRARLPPGATLLERSAAQLRELVGFDFHRGVLATVRPPEQDRTIEAIAPEGPALVVAVERLADPANLGAIVRTARALGATALLADPKGADPFSRRAIRASMAHVFHLPVEVPVDLRARVAQLRGQGFSVIATTLGPRARPLDTLDRTKLGDRVLLCLGHEGEGLAPELLALADHEVTIPIHQDVDSLNVAAAAAIILHALSPAAIGD